MSRSLWHLLRPLVATVVAPVLVGACGTSGVSDRFATRDDASVSETPPPPDASGEGLSPTTDPLLGGPCVDDEQCARPSIPCATFKCDQSVKRCRATPDDTRCDDGIYCNGAERCDPRLGCLPGAVVDCSTGESCAIDRCIEETRGCEHKPRDADGDGDPTVLCAFLGGKDCDDRDPTISSKALEICGNKKDDNCNGLIDETPCVSPANATCDTAREVSKPGVYPLALAGTKRTLAASCASTGELTRQVVVAVKVTDGPKDVDLTARAVAGGVTFGGRIALVGGKTCGDATGEIGCVLQPPIAGSVRLKLRALQNGVYPVYVFGATETNLELSVAYGAPTTAATNLTCGTATQLLDASKLATLEKAELVDLGKTPSACASAIGPLVYRVDIPATLGPRDLRVRASAGSAGVRTVLGFRDAGCVAATNELKCGVGYPADLFYRALPAGTYFVTLAAAAPTDVTIDAALSPPTPAPADASCTGAPALPRETTMLVDLKGHESRIAASCLAPTPTPMFASPPLAAQAAYALTLDEESDVLVVARPTGSDQIGLGLAAPACTRTDFGCSRGYPTRIGRRALAAGSYRVVVESATSSQVSLSTFVRKAAVPGPVGGEGCDADAVVIPAEGGLFVGSTARKKASFDESCDAPGVPRGGAPDVIYRLDVAKKSRLVVDMAGSAYTTVLSVRKGATCPGLELVNGCTAGYYVDNSFLDLSVDVGTYWIVVDGYALASGSYRMDVRVAPPVPVRP